MQNLNKQLIRAKLLRQLLIGKVSEVLFDKDSVFQSIQYGKDSVNLDPSDIDLEFRLEVESFQLLV